MEIESKSFSFSFYFATSLQLFKWINDLKTMRFRSVSYIFFQTCLQMCLKKKFYFGFGHPKL